MRLLLIAISVLGLAALMFLGVRFWQYSRLWPKPSAEVIPLTPDKRLLLQRLRAEAKFQPNDYPPPGYTGAETHDDEVRATAAVNRVIDAVLTKFNGPLHAEVLIALIGKGMREVNTLATEDRDRTQGYLLEIWYIPGFKGPTGLFAYGSAYPKPDGYGEPLPPGWLAREKPRPIENPVRPLGKKPNDPME
jgi:hypothetical protein